MYDVITAVPTREQMTEVRERTGLTQTELATIIGINLRNYQLRETCDRATNPGEYNLLMLLADNHPLYRIKGYTPEKDAAGIAEKLLLAEPEAAEVKRLRKAMGLKQQEVADRYGYTLGAWKSKEMASKRGTLRQAEYNFMLLLLDEHPTLKLSERKASKIN
ncbi:hypothetical protein [Mixta calida]|uniref:hypothetical protein n=1 Tax=Mixta calida TaxID=665913 RepID=UPI0028B164DE|nr:hypothetical protein [Mixta calida]